VTLQDPRAGFYRRTRRVNIVEEKNPFSIHAFNASTRREGNGSVPVPLSFSQAHLWSRATPCQNCGIHRNSEKGREGFGQNGRLVETSLPETAA
jgi:hypothetical protein